MNEMLRNKNISLGCALLNCLFAVHSFTAGSWLFGLLCVGCAAFCLRNYLKRP